MIKQQGNTFSNWHYKDWWPLPKWPHPLSYQWQCHTTKTTIINNDAHDQIREYYYCLSTRIDVYYKTNNTLPYCSNPSLAVHSSRSALGDVTWLMKVQGEDAHQQWRAKGRCKWAVARSTSVVRAMGMCQQHFWCLVTRGTYLHMVGCTMPCSRQQQTGQ